MSSAAASVATAPRATPFDDFEARPGSATSLVRTIVGLFLRDLGGVIASAELVRLLGAAGVAESHARTAITRVKNKGLLVADTVGGQPGYALNPGAVATLNRGDRRIYRYRQQGETEQWCLVSFTVPETQRDARHQLRKRLGDIGCGTVAHGLWIAPGHLVGEIEGILDDLDLRAAATLFMTDTPLVHGTLAAAAASWWDLDRLAELHRTFLAATAETLPSDAVQDASPSAPAGSDAAVPGESRAPGVAAAALGPGEAFARYVTAVDQWRILPYLDPGLPASMLPADWPGRAAVARFDAIRARLEPPARAFAGLDAA